jgi:hypothetical protein
MKYLNYISLLSVVLILLFSCKKEVEPKMEDHFLNYKILDIPVTQDYLVGVDYRFTATYGNALYKAKYAKTPVLGEYADIKKAITGSTALAVDSHLVMMNRAKIDFVVLTIRSGSTANSSYKTDTAYVNRILSSKYIGNIKIAFAYDFTGLGLGSTYPTATDSSMLIERKANALSNYILDYTTYMTPYFTNPSYLKLGNKNVVFIKNAYRLFARNNSVVTKQLRDALAVKSQQLYLVGQCEKWSPPQRYEHRFRNAVDAIYHDNYLGIATNDLTRLYQFNQVTDQAWKYAKAMFNSWGVEYIPNIGPSYNSNLNSPNAISPYYNPYFEKEPQFFIDYCNVGKANSDVSRLIMIDSWNNWSYDGQIEPATQYGDTYLKIVRDQFKKK